MVYDALPTQVFEALRRVVRAQGDKIQGEASDSDRHVLYFRRGGKNYSGVAIPHAEGGARLSLTPASAGALHTHVSAELAKVVTEKPTVADAPLFSGASADRLRTAIARACRAAGVPVFSPHDLRHRRISLLHRQGRSWAEIARFVGRRKLSITADTYTHVLSDGRELDYVGLLPQTAERGLESGVMVSTRVPRR
jgi:integrase